MFVCVCYLFIILFYIYFLADYSDMNVISTVSTRVGVHSDGLACRDRTVIWVSCIAPVQYLLSCASSDQYVSVSAQWMA